jgi:hypothetical protein
VIVGPGTGKGFEKKRPAKHEPKLRFRRLRAAVLIEADASSQSQIRDFVANRESANPHLCAAVGIVASPDGQ